MITTGRDRLIIIVPRRNGGSGRPARSLELRARSCFAHRPDYSSVFTQGLGLTQYNCLGNIRMIFGYRTLAYRANKAIRDGRPRPPRHQVGWDIPLHFDTNPESLRPFPRYGQITFLTFRRPTTLTFDLQF